MLDLRRSVLAFISLVLPTFGHAEPQPLVAHLVEESFDPIWPVSGNVIVGVMGHMGAHTSPSLLLFIGPDSDIRICAEVTSRSRNYRARLAVSHDALASPMGFVSVLSLTGNRDALAQFAGSDVAVRALPGDCLSGTEPGTAMTRRERPVYFIAGWGDQNAFTSAAGAELPDEVRLMVNARTSAAAVVVQGEGIDVQSRFCDREDDPRQSGFDFVCTISLRDAKDAGLASVNIDILRTHFGEQEEPVPAVLHLFRARNE